MYSIRHSSLLRRTLLNNLRGGGGGRVWRGRVESIGRVDEQWNGEGRFGFATTRERDADPYIQAAMHTRNLSSSGPLFMFYYNHRYSIPHRHAPWKAWMALSAITFANVVVFMMWNGGPVPSDLPEDLDLPEANIPDDHDLYLDAMTDLWTTRAGSFHQGNYFSLVTPCFSHAEFTHMMGNMFALWLFGFNLCRGVGLASFAALYLLGGGVSSLAHAWSNEIEGKLDPPLTTRELRLVTEKERRESEKEALESRRQRRLQEQQDDKLIEDIIHERERRISERKILVHIRLQLEESRGGKATSPHSVSSSSSSATPSGSNILGITSPRRSDTRLYNNTAASSSVALPIDLGSRAGVGETERVEEEGGGEGVTEIAEKWSIRSLATTDSATDIAPDSSPLSAASLSKYGHDLTTMDVPSLGASGSVFAIGAASAMLYPFDQIAYRISFIPFYIYIPIGFAMYAVSELNAVTRKNMDRDGVDHVAHVAGMGVGILFSALRWRTMRVAPNHPFPIREAWKWMTHRVRPKSWPNSS